MEKFLNADESNEFLMRIHQLSELADNIWQLELQPLEPYVFLAGQYTELKIPGLSGLYYSLASSPAAPLVELHLQSGSERGNQVIDWLQKADSVVLAAAAGHTYLEAMPQESGPLLLIASGTGFSQIKAINEDLIAKNDARVRYIYWSGHHLNQCYLLAKAQQWADVYPHIHLSVSIGEHNHWQEKQQQLLSSVFNDGLDLSHCQAIACGSADMVYALYDGFCEQGFRPEAMLSDVFDFAPRNV